MKEEKLKIEGAEELVKKLHKQLKGEEYTLRKRLRQLVEELQTYCCHQADNFRTAILRKLAGEIQSFADFYWTLMERDGRIERLGDIWYFANFLKEAFGGCEEKGAYPDYYEMLCKVQNELWDVRQKYAKLWKQVKAARVLRDLERALREDVPA